MDEMEADAAVADAAFEHAMGNSEIAVERLRHVLAIDAARFEAWHALAEILFQLRRFDEALAAGEKALALRPEDLFANTTLSRIWMEQGDKAEAEKFGAKAKILGWKQELKSPPDSDRATV